MGDFSPERLVEVFDRHGVEYLIVGGVAARAYGATRDTKDFDCLARRARDNLDRLAAAMRELNARLRVQGLSDAEAAQLPIGGGVDDSAARDLGFVGFEEPLGLGQQGADLAVRHPVEGPAPLDAALHEPAPHQTVHVLGHPVLRGTQAADQFHLVQLAVLKQQLQDAQTGGVAQGPEQP